MIEDRTALERTPAHGAVLDCLEAGIEAAHPRRILDRQVHRDGDLLSVAGTEYDLTDFERVIVVGGGNAAGTAAAALETILTPDDGVVVTDAPDATSVVTVHEGDHPLPTDRNVEGARRVLDLASDADGDTVILAPITGGGSALLAAPADGITLEELRTVTARLLESGATIGEINAVRKHCSAIKGGQLARTASPATVVGLLFSDVVGDDPSVIASGPLSPDPTTYVDARAVLERYGIEPPTGVDRRLRLGTAGDVTETPTEDDAAFDRTTTHVLGGAHTALEAAGTAARRNGYAPVVLSSRIRGEAREAAKTQVAIAEDVVETGEPFEPPVALLSGGETTVTVRTDSPGSGGPNQEFALSAAIELATDRAGTGTDSTVVGNVDTDGIDGTTDAAGAVVDVATVDSLHEAHRALDTNDAGSYLTDRGAVVRTGPTGTNVNDLRIVLIEDT